MSCFSVEEWIGIQVWSLCFVILNQPPAEILKLVTFALIGFWWPCSTCRGEKLYLARKTHISTQNLRTLPFPHWVGLPKSYFSPQFPACRWASVPFLPFQTIVRYLTLWEGESAEFGRSKVLPMTWHGKPLKQAICYHANWLLIIFYKYPVPPEQTFYQWGFWKTCIKNRVFHTPAIKIKIYCLKILLANQVHIWTSICI